MNCLIVNSHSGFSDVENTWTASGIKHGLGHINMHLDREYSNCIDLSEYVNGTWYKCVAIVGKSVKFGNQCCYLWQPLSCVITNYLYPSRKRHCFQMISHEISFEEMSNVNRTIFASQILIKPNIFKLFCTAHCGIVKPYADIYLCQHRLKYDIWK